MNANSDSGALRHARMPNNSAVSIMRGADFWSTELVDISATGVMVRRPNEWRGAIGEHYVLDMLVGPDTNIHVEASVARVTRWHIGFAYERIPPDNEAALWELLGQYADQVETIT